MRVQLWEVGGGVYGVRAVIGLQSSLGRRKAKGRNPPGPPPHPMHTHPCLKRGRPLSAEGPHVSKVMAADAGPRELSTPSWPARPPGTDLPTAGLDHQFAKWDHASEGVTSRLCCLAVFGGFSQQQLESRRPPPEPLSLQEAAAEEIPALGVLQDDAGS